MIVHIINLNNSSYRKGVLEGDNVFVKNVQKPTYRSQKNVTMH